MYFHCAACALRLHPLLEVPAASPPSFNRGCAMIGKWKRNQAGPGEPAANLAKYNPIRKLFALAPELVRAIGLKP